MLGGAAGGFNAVVELPVGNAYGIDAGAFDDDPGLDLAASDSVNGVFAMFTGAGTGGFAAAGVFDSGGGGAFFLTAADLNSDSLGDVIASSTNDDEVTVMLAVPDPDPEPPAPPSQSPPRLLCGGLEATIEGTPGADRLAGTAARDVIAAGAGADRVWGLGGNDLICGGSGTDRLSGGPGNDVLRGGLGRDRLRGGAGRDVLNPRGRGGGRRGGPTDDCEGGAGRDSGRCR